MAYDSQFFQHLSTISESKGCHLLSVNEKLNSIAVVNKRKLLIYGWQQPNFILRKEFNLPDIPKVLYYLNNFVVLGYKKHYEGLDFSTSLSNRILDIEKEHRMIIAEVFEHDTFLPPLKFR